MQYTDSCLSPLGEIILAADGANLTGLWFAGQKYFPLWANGNKRGELEVFCRTRRWLDIYFAGHEPDFTPPIYMEGSPFRKRVWSALREMTYGQTSTYGEIAERAAQKPGASAASPRAAGGAVAHNPISIIVPCQRVIGYDRRLTGYAGGIDRKLALMKIEGIDIRP